MESDASKEKEPALNLCANEPAIAVVVNDLGKDRSRCGEIDADIVDLVKIINLYSEYRTTSSCAGRLMLYRRDIGQRKRDTHWLLTSHSPLDWQEVAHVVTRERRNVDQSAFEGVSSGKGFTWFKYEAFILHCSCTTLESARKLLQCALASGFRESGVVLGSQCKSASLQSTTSAPWRLTVAVRSATGFDIPLCDAAGQLLVSEDYVRLVVQVGNAKLVENAAKRERFLANFHLTVNPPISSLVPPTAKDSERVYRRRRRAEKTHEKPARHEDMDNCLEEALAMFQQDFSI